MDACVGTINMVFINKISTFEHSRLKQTVFQESVTLTGLGIPTSSSSYYKHVKYYIYLLYQQLSNEM